MIFNDLFFGFADASKEFMIEPILFEKSFYDPYGIITQLQEDWKYIVVGRKGVGKSAFSSKLQSKAKTNNEIITFPFELSNFEYTTFSKTSANNAVVGTRKYKDSWDFILLLSVLKTLKLQPLELNDRVIQTIELLKKLGFDIDDEYTKNVKRLSKLKIGASIGVFDLNYEEEFGEKPIDFSERIGTLKSLILEAIRSIHIEKKNFILIDGLDDILRFKKNQLEILSSLIRSVDFLNEYFYKNKSNIKILLFIREDMLGMITDPDLNKIKRDGSIKISWCDDVNSLKEIIELRFRYSKIAQKENLISSDFFPKFMKNKEFWDYIFEFTLYKPRDVLQFLNICKSMYPNHNSLTYAEVNKVLKIYSKEYFLEEMKNEITGFVDDEVINTLPSVFRKLSTRSFSLGSFHTLLNDQSIKKTYNIKEVKNVLYYLFEAGYIGHIYSGGSVDFKYRNPTTNVDFSENFLIHKGLHLGLGIKLSH